MGIGQASRHAKSINARMARVLFTLQRAWEAGAIAPFADVLTGADAEPKDLDDLRRGGLVGGRHVPVRGESWPVEDFLSWPGGYADTVVYVTQDGRNLITSGPCRLLRAVRAGRGRRADLRAVLAQVAASLSDAGRGCRMGILEIRHGIGGQVLDEDEAAEVLKLQAHRPDEATRGKLAKMSEGRREELRQPLYLYATAYGRTCVPG